MEFFKQVLLKNGKQLIVRNADEKDVCEFTVFTNKLFKETNNFARGKEDEEVTEEMQSNYIMQHKLSKNSILLVAELNGKIVGHAHLAQKSSKIRMRHRSEFGIGILKEFWGMGIGKILMQEIISFANVCNYEQIELVVIDSNERAKNLYSNFGFEQFGIYKNTFKYKDNTYDDGVFMIKFLKDGNDKF